MLPSHAAGIPQQGKVSLVFGSVAFHSLPRLRIQNLLYTLNDLRLARVRAVKPLLVLAYVRLEGATPRRRLAELLWPEASQPDASLRVALHSLRSAGGKLKLLESEEPVTSRLNCDALNLLSARGETVLDIYSGPFLSGVALDGVSSEFEEWVYAQRERLAAHVQAELIAAARQQPPMQAAALAEQVFRLSGAPAPTPERLADLLALSLPGSPLESELRRELAELEAAVTPSKVAPRPRRLIGRDEELTLLLDWVAHGEARVALISGIGGVGKSALAGGLLRELGLQGRAVTFVNAEPLRSSSEVLNAVAQAQAGLPQPAEMGKLAQQLGEGHCILLDGVDGMPDLMEHLMVWTQEAPQLRWVLTGRRAHFGLPSRPSQTEHQSGQAMIAGSLKALSVRLSGLPIPEVQDGPSELGANPAVQLLLREARRFHHHFELSAENAGLLSSLARRLQGHPLGMLLACGWLAVEDLGAVHTRVLQSLSRLHDRLNSAHSLKAVAQQSWNLLPAATQRDLIRLVPFVDADPELLSAYGLPEESLDELLNLSILEAFLPGSERLRLHPTLAEFATEELQGEALEQARADHSTYFLNWVQAQPFAGQAVLAELPNVVRAAEYAARTGQLSAPLLDLLMSTYDASLQAGSGCDVFAALTDLLVEQDAPDDVQATAHIAQMWLAYRAERLLDAQTLATWFLGQKLAEPPTYRMKALNTLACVRKAQGQVERATTLIQEALHLAEELEDLRRQVFYTSNIIQWSKSFNNGHLNEFILKAEALVKLVPYELGLELRRTVLNTRIFLESEYPDQKIIKELTEISHFLTEKRNFASALSIDLLIAYQWLFLKDYRAALRHTQQIIGQAEAGRAGNMETSAHLIQAAAYYGLGRSQQARLSLQKAASLALNFQQQYDLTEVLLVAANDMAQAESAKVRRWVTALAQNKNTPFHFRQQSQRWLGEGSEQAEAGKLDLSESVKEVLAWLKTVH